MWRYLPQHGPPRARPTWGGCCAACMTSARPPCHWRITGVRGINTGGRTFRGSGRGGDLASHDAWMQTCFSRSGQLVDVPRLRRMWDIFRELPHSGRGDVMSHGDLIPGNVLVSGGRLAGVLDVGGLGPADPALDLVAAWHLLEPGPRQVFRDDLRCDDLDWERGKAWAFEQAIGTVWYYADSNIAMSQMGQRTWNTSRQTHRQPGPDQTPRRPGLPHQIRLDGLEVGWLAVRSASEWPLWALARSCASLRGRRGVAGDWADGKVPVYACLAAANRSRWCGALFGDRVAAVHDQVLPGDVGRAGAGQPGNGGGDLVG